MNQKSFKFFFKNVHINAKKSEEKKLEKSWKKNYDKRTTLSMLVDK